MLFLYTLDDDTRDVPRDKKKMLALAFLFVVRVASRRNDFFSVSP